MLHSTVLRSVSQRTQGRSQGFTLFELLITFVMFSILVALLGTGFTNLKNRYAVQAAFDQVQQVLREAQREAMREGQACTVTLDLSKQPITITGQNQDLQPCALNRTFPDSIKVNTSLNTAEPQIVFSYRGTVALANGQALTAIVYWADQPNLEKPCLVLTPGIGIMRTGNYTEQVTDTPDARHCEAKSQDGQ